MGGGAEGGSWLCGGVVMGGQFWMERGVSHLAYFHFQAHRHVAAGTICSSYI